MTLPAALARRTGSLNNRLSKLPLGRPRTLTLKRDRAGAEEAAVLVLPRLLALLPVALPARVVLQAADVAGVAVAVGVARQLNSRRFPGSRTRPRMAYKQV